jgi:D-alanyl-D-alanine carboxypeptidase
MTDIVENGDTGVFPPGFTDPVANPDLPWVVAAVGDQPDPVPEDRLDEEPADVEAEDRGQQVADELAAVPEEAGSGDVVTAVSSVRGIDLLDYSRNAQQKGWGAPCAARLATVTLRVARVTVDVRLAELVGLIMRANEARGYVYRAADTGAYNCRKIAGTTRWSNHAWAIAIDENWQTNPFTSPLRTDKPRWLIDRWNRYGFAWGGDYSGRKDPMHFEFMGSPAQAQAALELARRELSLPQ